jgi:pyruvate ferredoxin oxidoreductase gamma subunit
MSATRHDTVWLGRGGQGAFTAARLLGVAAARFAGREALAFPAFGPERRGAPVFAYTRIGPGAARERGTPRRADVLVVLDASLLEQVATPFVDAGTLLIVDGGAATAAHHRAQHAGRIVGVDAMGIAREALGSAHTNTALLGFLVGFTGLLPPDAVEAGILAEFGDSPRAHKNLNAFQRALQRATVSA